MRLAALLLLLASASTAQTTRYSRLFAGATAPAVSSAVSQAGQSVHILAVQFPTAAADVSGFAVRLEASFDGTLYFPLGEDITSAAYNGAIAYAITRANGIFPYVRGRLVTAHATLPLTAYYAGSDRPIGQFRLLDGRYVAAASNGVERYSWALCLGAPCTVSADVSNYVIVAHAGTLAKCWLAAKQAPTGAALTVDIKAGGVSVFGPGGFSLADGSSSASTAAFSAPVLPAGALLTVDITNVGSSAQGQDVSLVCTSSY